MDLITTEEIETLVRRAIRGKRADQVAIDGNTQLGDLGLSSLQTAEIVFSLEESRGIEFDPARAADAKTVDQLVAVGNAALQERAARVTL
jgi:acyl carrier protein